MTIKKQYGKLTAEDLRTLLSFVPLLEQAKSELDQKLAPKSAEIFTENSPRGYWCNYYEMPFPQHLAEVVKQFELEDDVNILAKSDNQVLQMSEFINKMNSDEDEPLTPEQKTQVIPYVLALNSSLIFSLRSLMVYGNYLNELIAIAREGAPSKRDKSLFKAIRIDPTVIGCPTAISRISRAVMLNEAKFLKDLRKAMLGKLGSRESKNFQMIRYVLQVLHERGGIHLNDKELKELFVTELNLYSDSQYTSEKNLKEFTYNFKLQKSTI